MIQAWAKISPVLLFTLLIYGISVFLRLVDISWQCVVMSDASWKGSPRFKSPGGIAVGVTGLCHASKHQTFCPFQDLMTPGMSGMKSTLEWLHCSDFGRASCKASEEG